MYKSRGYFLSCFYPSLLTVLGSLVWVCGCVRNLDTCFWFNCMDFILLSNVVVYSSIG